MYNNISIVISSHLSQKENDQFSSHLRKTIGLNNSQILLYENFNEYSLTEIYNMGLKESVNDIVLFIHNDIFFNTNNWGRILLNKFNQTDYAILGLAGTTDMNEDGIWWSDPSKSVGIVNHKHNNRTFESKFSNNYGKEIIQTVIVDGLFIAVNKNRIKNSFVEEFSGFHYYDLSFCIENHLRGAKIGVIFDIRVTHASLGATNEQYHQNRQKFIEKYKDNLPQKIIVDQKFDITNKKINLKTEPLLYIIIVNRNSENTLNFLKSLKEKSCYKNYKLLIGNTEEEKELNIENSIVVNFDKNKTDIEIRNLLVNEIREVKEIELILFAEESVILENDAVTIIVDTYLNNKKNIGTIGARIYNKNNTVRSCGYSLLNNKNKIYINHNGANSYYRYVKDTFKNSIANSGEFLLVKKDNFKEFNTEYKENYYDLEFSVNLLKQNKINIVEGNAVLTVNKELNKVDKDFELITEFIRNNYNNISKYIGKI